MTQTVPPVKTRRPRDMVISLAVLLVPIALAILGYRFLYVKEDVVAVDPASAVASAQRAGLPAFVATPQGWTVVSAQFSDGVLRVGYLTDEEKGVQLIQTKQQLSRATIAKDGETVVSGQSGELRIFVIGKNANLEPLTKSIPVTFTPMP